MDHSSSHALVHTSTIQTNKHKTLFTPYSKLESLVPMASISEEPKKSSGEQAESMNATMSKSNTGTLNHDARTAESSAVNANGDIASRIQGWDSQFTKVKNFVTTQGVPVQFNKDYFIAEADAKSDRRLDLEEHKWKEVVMNPKWRDGLYIQLRDADRGGAVFNLWYPGDQVWLCGRGSADVAMGKTRYDSLWFLKDEDVIPLVTKSILSGLGRLR